MNQSILLVDDSVTIRRYARSILEGMTEGYEVTERENGALALHWLSSLVDTEFPGLIIIDRNMPEMSGDECVRIIKMESGLAPKRYYSLNNKLVEGSSISFLKER